MLYVFCEKNEYGRGCSEMKYLVIGSGGREHALAWKLGTEDRGNDVYVLPGNGGIAPEKRVDIPVGNVQAIAEWCAESRVDLVVIGPEAPLADGIVDFLSKKKIPVFGPHREAARLESSKLFAKRVMLEYGVPTATHQEFTNRDSLIRYVSQTTRFPLVIKLDGLAAGKGVCVASSRDEALSFINAAIPEGAPAFTEEFIDGEEASVLCISDGEHFITLSPAQDHKRAFDGDRGPNTGGMGAYAPAPVMTAERITLVQNRILAPTIAGMSKRGTPFRGVLYAGIIIHGDDISVLEFNVRFGDPEAQVIIPLLNESLGSLLEASLSGTLQSRLAHVSNLHALTVVMASAGYPGAYERDKLITGLDRVGEGAIVFHAGTSFRDGSYYTNGGRVLNVTAVGATLQEARDKAYAAAELISFDGAFYRKDIGHRALRSSTRG